jgi:ribose/xylose/arabinose/galactoside ABC-type transport system permease subunit
MSLFRRHEFGLLFAILAVVLLTTVLDSQHNYWMNPQGSAKDIIRSTTLLGIFAMGAAIVIIAGGIDLSSGSVIAFGGTTCAAIMLALAPEAMLKNQPLGWGVIGIAIAGALLVGFLIGSLHAWLITVVELPPFIATLATLVGLRSFGRAVVESVTQRSSQIQIYDKEFRYLATSVWIPAILFLVLAALGWLLLSRTVVGRHLYALGGNEQAARLSGIQTDRLKWFAYCVSSMLSALAGILYIGDQAVADPQTLGRGYELNGIAAAVIGGCSLQGGIGTIPGTVLGALFLQLVVDGVSKTIKTSADVYEGLIVGVVIVVAVAFNQLRQAGRRGKRFFPGALGLVTILNLALLSGAVAAMFGPKLFSGKMSLSSANLGLCASGVATALLLLVREFERRQAAKKAA